MEKKKCPRVIKVSEQAKRELAKSFNCTVRTVYNALCFENISLLAKRIQYVALHEKGGWVEAAVPEAEIFYDTMEDGRHLMRQFFNNGAVLEVSMDDGNGVVMFKGEPVRHYKSVKIAEIPAIQVMAMGLR